MRFFDDDFFAGERNTVERQTGRLGLRHAFSPSSILLASVQYIDSESAFVDEDTGFFIQYFGGNRQEDGYAGEMQYLYRSRHFNLTSGVGYFDVDGSVYTRVEINPIFVPPPWNVQENTFDNSAKMASAYVYSYINPVDRLTIIAGVSADSIDGESPEVDEEDEVNPKLGISWQIGKGTTLRAAGFKTLRRTLITDQTLEPTNVAGFNQFFDDLIGTRATRYGGAIDQKIGKGSFVGAELSTRDLEIPFIDLDDDTVRSEDATERLGRAYVFVAPHRMLALRFEYQYEKFESDGATDLPVRLETKRFPIGINFFAPGGFSATATGTYYDQEGRFVTIGGQRKTGADTFWTVDLSLNYRLPKRLGFLSVGATNLLDEDFNYFDIDTRNPTIVPVRRIYGRVTLAF
jgi:hypothetical protein